MNEHLTRAWSRRRGLVAFASVLLGLGLAAPLAAQKLRFRQLTPDDGLSSSYVRSIVQDRQGFLWFGTSKGLDRYDGYGFHSYTHENGDSTSLGSATVMTLLVDRGGRLWVGTSAGLSRYDADLDRFVNYPLASAGAVMSILDDGRGTIWLGAALGLFRFDTAAGKATRMRGPLGSTAINTLYQDRAGWLWVGTQGAGLHALDPAGTASRVYRRGPDQGTLADDDIRALGEDTRGDLWVGTWNGGLARFERARGTFTRVRHDAANPASIASDRIVTLRSDGGRGLWVAGENGGLDHLDVPSGIVAHNRPDPNDPLSLNDPSIWAIHVDETGALWLGTHSGGVNVTRRNTDAVRRYQALAGDANSLSFNIVRGFAEDRQGRVWVATDGGGLNRFDPASGSFAHFSSRNSNLNSDAVLAVAEDREGAIWIGTWAGGISRFDGRGGFTAYNSKTSNLPDDNVFSLLVDHAGRLWVGTRAAGLLLFDRARARFTPYVTAQQLGELAHNGSWSEGGANVRMMRETRDGRFIVLATEASGLALLETATGRLTTYRTSGERGLADNGIRSLLEEPAGTLWVGTGNGLDRLDLASGRIHHFTRADGLPSNFVGGLVSGRPGELWASTDRGVLRFTPEGDRLTALEVYTRADGLQGTEFNPYAYARTRDGALLFGGNNGFNLIRPDRIVRNPRKPPVVLTGFALFNQPVRIGAKGSPLERQISRLDRLALSYKQSVVTFDFAALDYTAPEKNRYAYRLEGFDERWNEIGQEHSATYTNLPAGKYVFRVKASNADGVWNEEGVALAITVKPPFWRTWWFRTLVLLLIAFGVGRYLRATRERHRELERINRRLAEAADRDRLSQQYLERNVLEILGAMESFSEGDLSVSLPVDSDDAIGRLRRGFNTSVANIRGMVLQLQELVHATAAASEEILASTEELARQAEEQMQQSGRVAGSMERMRQSTEENARHMGAAAELAQRSGQDAEQGTVIVRDTLTGMDQIVSMVGNAAEAVQTLRGSGERIGQITAVISEIAGETNLVALNAAIEAARAGEHGRTFSVVAEEVRKLADRAELAAHEIADVIEQNQADIARAVAIMGEVGGQVGTGKHLVDEAGSALDSVIANSQRVIASIGQVTRAGEEQTAASQNVAATVEAIASGSRAAAEGNQVINRAVEDLNRLIEDVQERVGQFQLEGGRKAPAPAAIAGAAAVPV